MSLFGFKNHQANKMGNEYCYRYYKHLNEKQPKEEVRTVPKKRKSSKKTSRRRYPFDEEEEIDDNRTWNRVLIDDIDEELKEEDIKEERAIGSLRDKASKLARAKK